MKFRMLWCATALAGAVMLWGDELLSQEAAVPADSKNESLVDNWVRYAMPSKHHKLLGKMAGRWKMAVKYRMKADAPVVESQGTCERKWILGGRFLLEEFDGGTLGLPFQGMAIYGYDPFEDQYTSVWLDTMSTAMTTNRGRCQDDCQTIHFTVRHGDPWTGAMRPSRGITRFLDDDRHVLEVHEPDASGTEFKILEIVYTRR